MDNEGLEDLEELYYLEQSLESFEDYEVLFSSESDNESDIEVDNYENPEIVELELQSGNVIEHKNGKKAFELKDKQRQHIVQELILAQEGKRFCPRGKSIAHGSIKKLADRYNVHRTTIGRIWTKAKDQFGRNGVINVCSRKRERGRKKLEFDPAVLAAVPVHKTTTRRALSQALHLSNTTVYRLLRAGILRAHTNSIKPSLKHLHKVKRVQFIINSIIPGNVNELPKFSAMYNMVHIDEKWFFMSDKTQRFYLFPWEDDPYRATQSKTFMEKVMVMAGTARPHICNDGEILWDGDGKIGVFPFTEQVVAQKNSNNRAAGTVETKALQSVTKSIVRSMLIEKMLPAITSKWPLGACKEIWIQQDNARPHISPNDTEFVEAATKDGFDIKLINQPAKSSDLNILDLGFFRAITLGCTCNTVCLKYFKSMAEIITKTLTREREGLKE